MSNAEKKSTPACRYCGNNTGARFWSGDDESNAVNVKWDISIEDQKALPTISEPHELRGFEIRHGKIRCLDCGAQSYWAKEFPIEPDLTPRFGGVVLPMRRS